MIIKNENENNQETCIDQDISPHKIRYLLGHIF